MADYNGDLRLLAHRIGETNKKIDSIDTRLETNIAVTQDRLRECEKQTALHEQSMHIICKKVEDLDDDVRKINLVSKIIGGITGGLAILAAAIGISK